MRQVRAFVLHCRWLNILSFYTEFYVHELPVPEVDNSAAGALSQFQDGRLSPRLSAGMDGQCLWNLDSCGTSEDSVALWTQWAYKSSQNLGHRKSFVTNGPYLYTWWWDTLCLWLPPLYSRTGYWYAMWVLHSTDAFKTWSRREQQVIHNSGDPDRAIKGSSMCMQLW